MSDKAQADQTGAAERRTGALRLIAAIVGAVFLLVGILGFIPGITTDYGTLQWYGPGSDAELLGIFQVSVLHNLIHLVFGVAGLAMSATAAAARAFLIGGGVIYLLLWIYGMVIDKDSMANVVPVNRPDDWLHLGLGVGMIALGLLGSRVSARGA